MHVMNRVQGSEVYTVTYTVYIYIIYSAQEWVAYIVKYVMYQVQGSGVCNILSAGSGICNILSAGVKCM